MKTNTKVSSRGFTLIEMVGVLAVIAILAALLVPKIFSAINDSRFSSSVESLNNVKTACMDYFGRVGNFQTNASTNFCAWLISSNCLERPLSCKVSTNAYVEVVAGKAGGAGAGGFKLDGTADATAAASQVVECVLEGVGLSDARELSLRMDGAGTPSPTTGADAAGRVVFTAADPTTVYIYVAHK